MWIGDDDRVTVGVLTAGRLDAARSTAVSLAASVGLESAAVNVVAVRHSLAKLVEASDWLADRLAAANDGATSELSAGGYTTSGNAVRLGLPAAPAVLTSAQEAAVAEVRQRYGDMLTTFATTRPAQTNACTNHYCDVPLRGGVRYTVAGYNCTLGFIGRNRADGALWAITAGHCLRGRNLQNATSRFASGAGPHIIGPARRYVFDTRGDAGAIQITNHTGWKPQARIFVSASGDSPGVPGTVRNELYPIRRDGLSSVGLRICKRGYNDGTDCGRVTGLNASIEYRDKGVTVRGLATADYCSVSGDSGGPVFAGNTAYGIHSGYYANLGGCHPVYQGIRGAENLMSFNVSFV